VPDIIFYCCEAIFTLNDLLLLRDYSYVNMTAVNISDIICVYLSIDCDSFDRLKVVSVVIVGSSNLIAMSIHVLRHKW